MSYGTKMGLLAAGMAALATLVFFSPHYRIFLWCWLGGLFIWMTLVLKATHRS